MFKQASPLHVANDTGAAIMHYASDNETINAAMDILARQMRSGGEKVESLEAAKKYLQLQIGNLSYEAFWVVFLDPQLRVIAAEEMWRGSVSTTPAYPREVVRRALEVNAVYVLFAHNHPSGVATPSDADRSLTQAMVRALAPIEITVLDHMVIAGADVFSFAEHKLMSNGDPSPADLLKAIFGVKDVMSEAELLKHLVATRAAIPHNEIERIAHEDQPGREAFRVMVAEVVAGS